MSESVRTAAYVDIEPGWPHAGRHILAQADGDTILVYQAYKPEIADHVLAHGTFGGPFSYRRMSGIKPNFLWMTYRSGWGTKSDQERVLALRLSQAFFEDILADAVPTSFAASGHETEASWRRAMENSDVRMQWDPDHDPHGRPLARRAIQLGLRRGMLARFGQDELREVIDLTPFVAAQRAALETGALTELRVPVEVVWEPSDPQLALAVGLSTGTD